MALNPANWHCNRCGMEWDTVPPAHYCSGSGVRAKIRGGEDYEEERTPEILALRAQLAVAREALELLCDVALKALAKLDAREVPDAD